MAKKKTCEPIGDDMNGRPLSSCSRVEISPHFDLWMQGARTGTVRGKKNGLVLVKMDNTRVRRLFRAKPGNLKRI